MTCPSPKKIASYLLEELTVAESQTVVSHIEACEDCEAVMSSMVEELALGEERGSSNHVASNLLFAVLALHNSYISRQQLVNATSEWLENKQGDVHELLVRQSALSKEDCRIIQALVQKHLSTNGDSLAGSLAGLSSLEQVEEDLRGLNDPDVDASLDSMPIKAQASQAQKPSAKNPLAKPKSIKPQSAKDKSSASSRPSLIEQNRYEELRHHAKGGLGEVFVALDRQLDRNVALKRIQPKMVDDQMSRIRFEQEAEVTGKLEHPGVVPVYGRGADRSGRPFYAMRFIEGRTLKEHITEFHRKFGDGSWRSGEARIQLLALVNRIIDVCHTIEYAHHRGVLHRDLKPDNVMLGRFGETLVVDWGLAKRADVADVGEGHVLEPITKPEAGASDITPTPTTFGTVVGTLGYMSPEQAAGDLDAVGTPSDVYGLGAILYRTLTNKTSQDPKEKPQVTLDRIARGQFPEPCSLKSQIPTPLESICLQAMALRPDDRYASPEKLADDLSNWIADEKVQAHKEGAFEKVVRLARRYRGIAATAVAASIVLAAVSVAFMAYKQAKQAKQQARHNLVQARETIDSFLTSSAEDLRHLPGVQGFQRHLLDEAAQRYDQLLATSSSDPLHELERARTLLRLGDVYFEVGERDRAAANFESAKSILESTEDVARLDDGRYELANCLTRQARMAVSVGEPNDEKYRAAIEIYESLISSASDRAEYLDALASACAQRASAFLDRDELAQAQEWAELALKRYQGAMEMAKGNAEAISGVSSALSIKGEALRRQGKHDEARKLFADAVREAETLLRKNFNNRDYFELLADARSFLAQIHRLDGDVAAERAETEAALNDYTVLRSRFPDVVRYQQSAARARMGAGQLELLLGKSKLAEARFTAAKQELEQLSGKEAASPRYTENLAVCLDNLAVAQINLANFKAALDSSAESVRLLSSLDATLHQPRYRHRLAVSLAHHANAYAADGNWSVAQGVFDQAAFQLNQLLTTAPANEAEIYSRDLALVLEEYGSSLWQDESRRVEASTTLAAAKTIWTNLFAAFRGETERISPWTRHAFARFLILCPDVSLRDNEAAVTLARAITDSASSNPDFQAILAAAHFRLGLATRTPENLQQALVYLNKATELRPEPREFDQFFTAMTLRQLAMTETEIDEAKVMLQTASKMLQENNPGSQSLLRLEQEAVGFFERWSAEDSESASIE